MRPDKLRKLLWLAYYQYNSKRNKRAILINLFRLNENSKGNNYKGDLITDKVLIFRSSSIERFNSVIEWVIDNMKPDEVTAVLQKDIIDRIRKDYINRVIQIEPGKIEWKLYRKILDKNIARDDKFDLIFPCTDNYSINYSNLLYIAFKLKAKKIVFKSEDKILIMFKEELFYRLLKIAIVNIVHVILDKFGGYSLINYISKKRLINLAEENIK